MQAPDQLCRLLEATALTKFGFLTTLAIPSSLGKLVQKDLVALASGRRSGLLGSGCNKLRMAPALEGKDSSAWLQVLSFRLHQPSSTIFGGENSNRGRPITMLGPRS